MLRSVAYVHDRSHGSAHSIDHLKPKRGPIIIHCKHYHTFQTDGGGEELAECFSAAGRPVEQENLMVLFDEELLGDGFRWHLGPSRGAARLSN